MFFSLAHYRFFFFLGGGFSVVCKTTTTTKKNFLAVFLPSPKKSVWCYCCYFSSIFFLVLSRLLRHACLRMSRGRNWERGKKKVPGNEESVFSTVFRVHAQRRRTGASWFFFFFTSPPLSIGAIGYTAVYIWGCHLFIWRKKKKENSQEVEETHNNRRKSCSNSHNKKEESKKKNCSSHFFFLCRLFFPHFSFPPSWYIYILFVCLFLFFLRLTFFHFFFLFSLSPTVLQDYPHVNWVFSFLCSIFFSSLSRFVCCDFLMCCFYISLLFIHILSCLCLDLPRFWCYLCFFFPSFSVFFFP